MNDEAAGPRRASMPKQQEKAPKLTKHQRYMLGTAVEAAWLWGWNGKINDGNRPSFRRGRGLAAPTREVLLREGMLEAVPGSPFQTNLILTRLGIEAGEAECLERLGGTPKALAAERRSEEKRKKKERLADVAGVASSFKGVKIRPRRGKHPVSLEKLICKTFREGYGSLSFDLDELRQLASQVKVK
jgi:hypothetical protein